MPDAVPEKGRILIAGIDSGGDSNVPKEVTHVAAAASQEGADDESIPHRPDARQSARSRTLNDPHQDGLRLIVHRVGRRGLLCAQTPGGRFEELVPEQTARFFQGNVPGPLSQTIARRPHLHRKSESIRRLDDEFLIESRLGSPKLVVEVSHMQAEPQVPGECMESVQQGDRIGPAGHGRENEITRVNHTMVQDGFPDPLNQGRILQGNART